MSSTFSRTVRQGNRVASWKTYPRLERSTSTSPAVCWSRPEAIFRSVDFPQPEGPTTVTNSPWDMEKEMSRSASDPSGKVIEMPRNVSASVAGASIPLLPSESGGRNLAQPLNKCRSSHYRLLIDCRHRCRVPAVFSGPDGLPEWLDAGEEVWARHLATLPGFIRREMCSPPIDRARRTPSSGGRPGRPGNPFPPIRYRRWTNGWGTGCTTTGPGVHSHPLWVTIERSHLSVLRFGGG